MVSKWGSGDGVLVDGKLLFISLALRDGRYSFRNRDGSVFFAEESELSEYWVGNDFGQGDIVEHNGVRYEVLSYQPSGCRLYQLDELHRVRDRVKYIDPERLTLWVSEKGKVLRELDRRGITGSDRQMVLDVCSSTGLKDWER